jgi:membrane-bound lytic murein transglycosylase B
MPLLSNFFIRRYLGIYFMNYIFLFFMRFIIFFFCLILLEPATNNHSLAFAEQEFSYFDSLEEKLIKNGFDRSWIKKIYSDSKVKIDIKGLSSFFTHREAKLDYGQFTSKRPVKRAKKYLKKHKKALLSAEKKYGVDKKIITSILLVETQLGKYTGYRSTLNILSTMAALSDLNVRDRLWKEISGSVKLKKEDFNKWSDRKSKWAHNELENFLNYVKREGFSPHKIKGSYAGAVGICQFMPSNIMHLAIDGDNDNIIDLFRHADAIASVANYLKHHGWYSGIDRKKASKVLYKYNHSNFYVNAILKVADRL